MPRSSVFSFTFLAITSLTLVACGGGGGSTLPAPRAVTPPTGGGTSTNTPAYTPNVFTRASTFKDRCQVPRSGFDIEGNAFPDRAGSITLENFWLRSWTHETYLWNDEVTDQNPYSFNTTAAYFDQMRTFMTAPSGSPKDNFHFSEPTEDFLESRNSVGTASYGVSFIGFQSSPPRDFRVRYADPGTPASALEGGKPKFVRGARILEIDGVDFVNDSTSAGLDILNAGLFPVNPGETHSFTLREPDGTVRSISVTSEDLSPAAVNRVRTIDTATGRVGYILFNTFSPFSSEVEIINAVQSLDNQGVTDLVVDLRYNGGGLLAVSSQLAYMVAGPTRTSGRTFELLQFNADAGNRNPVTGEVNDPIPFYSTALGFSATNGTPLPDLGLTRVFILSTGGTCSASEALINGLRGVGIEVILIGDRTCGKPFGFYPTDNCGTTYYTIQFRGVNDVGFGDFAEGFAPTNANAPFAVDLPGCRVADDINSPLGDPAEALLAAALQYREDQSCPVAPASLSPLSASSTNNAQTDESLAVRMPVESLATTNRDMRLPGDIQ